MTKGFYHIQDNILEPDELSALLDGIRYSDYLGASPLGKEFVNTQGFSLIFKRLFLNKVQEAFPYLDRYLQSVLFAASNAFYINPLILQRQSRVDSHIDCRELQDKSRIVPTLVSVFYAEIPNDMQGGELILNCDGKEVTLTPKTNRVVHFLGRLLHRVTQMESNEPRISVVCEQYNLDDKLLACFPDFEILTGASALAHYQ